MAGLEHADHLGLVFGETTRSAVTWSSWRFSTGEYQKKSRLFCFTIAGLSSILMPFEVALQGGNIHAHSHSIRSSSSR